MIEITRTERGFAIGKFKDYYGEECSIQESSLAEEECIWLGLHALNFKEFRPNHPEPWIDFELPPNVHVAQRMHLTRDQAGQLIEVLQRFVETGSLAHTNTSAPEF